MRVHLLNKPTLLVQQLLRRRKPNIPARAVWDRSEPQRVRVVGVEEDRPEARSEPRIIEPAGIEGRRDRGPVHRVGSWPTQQQRRVRAQSRAVLRAVAVGAGAAVGHIVSLSFEVSAIIALGGMLPPLVDRIRACSDRCRLHRARGFALCPRP